MDNLAPVVQPAWGRLGLSGSSCNISWAQILPRASHGCLFLLCEDKALAPAHLAFALGRQGLCAVGADIHEAPTWLFRLLEGVSE